MNILPYPSPNYGPRPSDIAIDLIVIHYTGMESKEAALKRLCDPASQVSAHFLIGKEGEVYQLVDPACRAWHAGVSTWDGVNNVNDFSIGIELDNLGHEAVPQLGGAEPYAQPQLESLISLLKNLVATYNIPPHRIVGHSDVAPGRKQDPGELFPWDYLAKLGLGFKILPQISC